ncbi:hypothetical protein [Helicobacter sp. T3_23-1056]
MSYMLNDEKMFADVTDGIAIIINSETGIYYGLNAFGTQVYENLVAGASVANILESAKKIPNIPADFESNLKKFVDSMLSYGILVETSADSSAEVKLDEAIAKEDKYELDLKEYDDAQELLLADPIHEVKEDTGWTPEKDSIGYTKEQTAEREKKIEE